MNDGRIKEAVVLAAGNGRRLASPSGLPKPLISVAGRSLIRRVLDRLFEAQVERVYVVIGYRAQEIQQQASLNGLGDRVRWVQNEDYHLANGLSLLAVKKRVKSPFLLLMSDHLFESSTLQDFVSNDAPDQGGVLAVDSKIESVFDLPDATKVVSNSEHIRHMGKDLETFNAIDTGIFALTPSVFEAMHESASRGDHSLTGGISVLARTEGVRTWDIGERRWIDIDTPEALREAERLAALGLFK